MDTWATSSMSPQIAGRWLVDKELYEMVFPTSLRPQGHEIIRTWAFYTIVKALYHTGEIPWQSIMVSGHALTADRGKISKSKAHQESRPMPLIEQESSTK